MAQLVHGKTGWIVDNEENAIHAGLRYLLEHPDVREQLRDNAGMERILDNGEKYEKFKEICGV